MIFFLRSLLVVVAIASGLSFADGLKVMPTNTGHAQGVQELQFRSSRSLYPIVSCAPYKHRHNIDSESNLHNYTSAQLQQYFKRYNYSEQHILDQELLYLSDEFVKLAKTCVGYEKTIERLYKKFKKFGPIEKVVCALTGSYCSGLKLRIEELHQEIELKKCIVKNKSAMLCHSVALNILLICYRITLFVTIKN